MEVKSFHPLLSALIADAMGNKAMAFFERLRLLVTNKDLKTIFRL